MKSVLSIFLICFSFSGLYAQDIERVQSLPDFAEGHISVTFMDTASQAYSHSVIEELGFDVVHSTIAPVRLFTRWTYPDSLLDVIKSSPQVDSVSVQSMGGNVEQITFSESMSDEDIERMKERLRNSPPMLRIRFSFQISRDKAQDLLDGWGIGYSDHNLQNTPRKVTAQVPVGEELASMKTIEALPAVVSTARIAIPDYDAY